VLASIGEVALDGEAASVVFEEGVGPISVTVRVENGRPTYCALTAARLPVFGPPPPPMDDIAAVLSLHPDEIRRDDFSPRGASCGVPFFFVPLRDERALARTRPDLSVWERSFSNWWAPPPENGTLRWVVDQGVEMGRPSRLYVECDRSGERVTAVRVGGSAVMVAEGSLALAAN
jgi:trans-2,3-dihydro-3-hydroxyanthranilate isomerase